MIKPNKNHILAILAVALAAICVSSIIMPINFTKEQERREREVKSRLMGIRLAEEKYCKSHGVYAASFDSLIAGGFLADSMQYVPYSENKRFELSATVIIRKSGRQTPLMECGAKYADYLTGMDGNTIMQRTVDAENKGKYPGLKIGDITTPNNNAGNWE